MCCLPYLPADGHQQTGEQVLQVSLCVFVFHMCALESFLLFIVLANLVLIFGINILLYIMFLFSEAQPGMLFLRASRGRRHGFDEWRLLNRRQYSPVHAFWHGPVQYREIIAWCTVQ